MTALTWPGHYEDGDVLVWCMWSGVSHASPGPCPKGCAGSVERALDAIEVQS